MKNMRSAVIAGAIAAAAVIAAIIIIIVGNAQQGIYITAVTGDVSISNQSRSNLKKVRSETKLSQGDSVTVSENSSCTVVYRTSRNKRGRNYMTLLSETQVVIADKFKGKEDADIYLSSGTVISSNSEDLGACANIRTANAEIETSCSVSAVSYVTDGETSHTDVSSMGGTLYILLCDEQGTAADPAEPLGPSRKGRITSGKNGPYFAYLNEDLELSDFNAEQLREFFTISSYVRLEYTPEQIKEAYDAIPREERSEAEPEDLDSVTTPSISEAAAIQTAEPILTDVSGGDPEDTVTTIITSGSEETEDEETEDEETEDETEETEEETSETTTEETESETSGSETEAEDETVSETTSAPPSESETETNNVLDPDNDFDEEIYTVRIIINGVTTEQEVFAGGNAVQPADPKVEGKKFIGWDNSFNNIRSDRTIRAIFEDDSSAAVTTAAGYHTVTVIVGNNITAQTVKDGDSASLPSVNVEGYTFSGWDADASNVKGDMTVHAILDPISCNVTFIVDGISYFTTVNYGGTAAAPVTPAANSSGQPFTGWDKSLSNIKGDTTISAVFATPVASATYTVTFIVEGVAYSQTVDAGSSAIAPPVPQVNAEGKVFVGWDSEYSDIEGDTTITAVYE